jgi:hypothetical protein
MANCVGVPLSCVLRFVLTCLKVGNEFEVTSNSNEFSICFCISDNVRVPDRGLKTKAIIQSAFALLFRCDKFKGEDDGNGAAAELSLREVTAYESMLQPLHKDAG